MEFICSHCGARSEPAESLLGHPAKCMKCGAAIIIANASPLTRNVSTMTSIDRAYVQEHSQLRSAARREEATGRTEVIGAANAATTLKAELVLPKLSMRQRRLIADKQQVLSAFARSPLIRIEATQGDPPFQYVVKYLVRGLCRNESGQLVVRDQHLVEIQLTSEYPRQSPKCRMLSPIFHPNIEPAVICVGDHWTAGERLLDLIVRIGEMIAFQAYNIKSPLDGEAAMWVDRNRAKLPIDSRELTPHISSAN